MEWYALAHDLTWVALRYFNAAGADADGDIGEDHDPETHLIPRAIDAALGRRSAVKIMGIDYPTPDGSAVRDYIHVADLATANVAALKYLFDGGKSTAFNLGIGRGYSVRDVIAAVERVSGHPVPVLECGRGAGDPPVLIAENSRAWKVLGWTPRYVNLDPIVSTAYRWHAMRHALRETVASLTPASTA